MKDKLSVGMFIRTPLGIDKIIYLRIQDEYGCNFDTQLKHNLFLNNERDNISIDGECFEKEEIKANYNIIDILEEGDYVNGNEVMEADWINENGEYEEGLAFPMYASDDLDVIENWLPLRCVDIKSIVTKEQFSSIEYKVGEE